MTATNYGPHPDITVEIVAGWFQDSVLNQLRTTYTRRTTMLNETNRKNLRSVLDLVAEGHRDIMDKAAELNARLLKLDARAEKFPEGKLAISKRFCQAGFTDLQKAVVEQHDRLERASDEIDTIQGNLKVSV